MKTTEHNSGEQPARDLAPCPFCGGAPVPDFIVDSTYLIKCSSCKTRSWFQASAADAVAAWNRRAVKPFNAAPAAALSDADYAAIVKRYEDAGDAKNADIIRRQWMVARGGNDARSEDLRNTIRTWRERIGVGAEFPLHAPTDVERAMVAEIAELRAAVALAIAPADADSRQLVVVGGQRVGKSILLDLQRDAARYRWLRDKADDMACTAAPMVTNLDATGRVVGLIDGEELDAAVDMAAARRTTKTKRVGAHR